jgi:hypothetical protein
MRSRIARIEKAVWPHGKAAGGVDAAWCAMFAASHPGNPDWLATFLDQHATDGEPIPLAVPARLREFIALSRTAQDEGELLPPSDYLPITDMASLNETDEVIAVMYQYRCQSWHATHAREFRYSSDRGRQLAYFADRLRDALGAWIHNRHEHPSLKARPMTDEELDAYCGDATAFPAAACDACGSLLPITPGRHVDGVWRRRVVRLAQCPCGSREFTVEDTAFYDFGPPPTVARANPEARQPQPSEVQSAPCQPEQQRSQPATPARRSVADEPADDFGLAAYAPARRPWPPDRPR